HSFPTRRSSDLVVAFPGVGVRALRAVRRRQAAFLPLVVAVNNRGEAGAGTRGDAEVVVEVAVAGARDAGLADAAAVDDRRRRAARPGRAGLQGVEVLREPHRPGGPPGVGVRGLLRAVVAGLVVDDVELAGVSGRRPREDLGAGLAGDSVGAVPGRAVVPRERVVDVVVVGVDRVDVSGRVDRDVDELVAVVGLRAPVHVDRAIGEGAAAVRRDGHVDAVVAARPGQDAGLRSAGDL